MVFAVGQELQLVFSAGLNPAHFSCQQHSKTKLLQTLLADIDCTASGTSTSLEQPVSLLPGDCVLALSSADKKWYRAQVVSFNPSSDLAEVLFVDYGHCHAVPRENVKVLPKDFVTLPKQSITCSLSGVKPAVDEDCKWNPAALQKLEQLAAESEFMTASVKSVSEANIIEVSLSSDTCEDFSKALVKSGCAVFS